MVVVRLMGGLGNQMFQYALGRHLALKNNEKLYLDLSGLSSSNEKKTVQRDCDLFHLSVNAEILHKNHVDFSYTPIGLLKFYTKKYLHQYPYSLVQERGLWDIVMDKLGNYSGWFNFHKKLLLVKNAYLIGFWQSFKYFEDIRDVLLKDFESLQVLDKKNADFLTSIKHKTTVSIHVRRGDYDDVYHGFCSLEYYQKAIHHMVKTFSDVQFVVFSNDISRCKDHLDLADAMYVDWNTGANSYLDLILMSNCHHNIIANSSFSWWGAWLNTFPNKQVIAARPRFKISLDTQDLLPQEWIRM